MARFTVEHLEQIDAQALVEELQAWQDELSNDIEDEIIYNTLDTVIDIVVNM